MKNTDSCPCCSGKTFGKCCGPVLSGVVNAATAADLMRARYTAYVVGDVDFLYKSSAPEVQAEFDRKTTEEWSHTASWQGLEIRDTVQGQAGDEEGVVSFTAHYSANGQVCEHRERSLFKKINGEWRFFDGVMEAEEPYRREAPKIGRNDPCPCGSGKKYKKCCGRDVK